MSEMCLKRKLNSSFGLVLALFCMCAVSCANIFQDKVAMSRNGSSATLGDLFVGGRTKTGKLDAPSQITVSQYEFNNMIRISWSSVKNARYYTVKRASVVKDDNGEWKTPNENELIWEIVGNIFGTTCDDILIKDDVNNGDPLDYTNKKYEYVYYYSVSAGNDLLGYDPSDETISTWAALLPPPLNVKASLGSSDEYIKITWKGNAGAKYYKIYRSSQSDGKNSVSLPILLYPSETSYIDYGVSSFKGANLYYTICSVNGLGNESVASSVAMGYTALPGAPGGVEEVVVTKGHGENQNSIEIQWKALDADDILYNIYRSDLNDNTMRELVSGISVNGEYGTYTDNGSKAELQQNTYYYYYVQSYKTVVENGEEVTYNGPVSVTGPAADLDEDSFDKYAEGFILSAPSTVEVQKPDIAQKNDPYTVLFTPAIGDKNFSKGSKGSEYSNNYEYIVFGGDSEYGAFTELTRASSNSLQLNDGKYSITPSNPQRKFYKMQVANGAAFSAQTNAVAPAPYAPTDVYVTCAALVGNASDYVPATNTSETEPGSNDNGVHPVKIVWTAPEGDDAAYYNIYRKNTFEGTNWGTPINDEPVSGTSYIDKNANARVGRVYYYSVVSLNSLKQGANGSLPEKPELIGSGADAIIKTYNINIDGKSTRCGKGWGWGAPSAWQYIKEMCITIMNSHERLGALKSGSTIGDKMKNDHTTGMLYGDLDYKFSLGSMYATVHYTNYADYWINNDSSLGYYFLLNGNTDTKADMSMSGNMLGTVICKGMYPGSVKYDNIEISGGNANKGYYELIREGIDGGMLNVSWLAGQ